MGRVEAAMRRAAELGADPQDVEAAPRQVEPAPLSALAGEAGAVPGEPFGHLDPQIAQKLVIDKHVKSGPREQYRRCAAALHHAQEANGLKVVMIASAMMSEGKT